MDNKGIVKKFKIALFLNKGDKANPEWIRVKKSTAFDLALNPETQDYDYIADESPTTELIKYKPALNQSLTMYKGEADYDLVFEKFFNMETGEDAKTDVLIVFYQEESIVAGTGGGDDKHYFKAWCSDCVISISNLNSVDSTISFDILFGGTVKRGYIEEVAKKPVFTEGAIPA